MTVSKLYRSSTEQTYSSYNKLRVLIDRPLSIKTANQPRNCSKVTRKINIFDFYVWKSELLYFEFLSKKYQMALNENISIIEEHHKNI